MTTTPLPPDLTDPAGREIEDSLIREAKRRARRRRRIHAAIALLALVGASLAVGVASGRMAADRADVQSAEGRPDVTISPSCFAADEAPPVPDSAWAGDGFVSADAVSSSSTVVGGSSCTLVLRYWFHRFGPGPFLSGMVWLYSDGRLIIDTATQKDWFVQWERRLTPEGAERLRSTVVAMLEESGSRLGDDSEAAIHYGEGILYPKDPGALVRLLVDRSWLSDEDWVTESASIYRAAWYLTCYEMRGPHGDDVVAAVHDLPPAARIVLDSRVWTTIASRPARGDAPSRCVVLSRADATVLAYALGGDVSEGKANVFAVGLDGSARQFSVHALMPDGTSGAHGD